jgi:hypothetical protein
MYDYAHYNETILGNKSYIVSFTEESQKKFLHNSVRITFSMFEARFTILQIEKMEDMAGLIDTYKIDAFMCQQPGDPENHIYKYNDTSIWKGCKTIKYCVFSTQHPEGDSSITVSAWLNRKNNTSFPVLPCIVTLPEVDGDLRAELGIPTTATVFGGYGGRDRFNIEMTRQVVHTVAKHYPNTYFLFANFDRFCEPLPNIIHLPMILDRERKVKFIQTCDAMLWARSDGETFGLAIAEFSLKNKPVLCTAVGDLSHIYLLGDKAVIYTNAEDLAIKLLSFNKEEARTKDWNAYRDYTPEKVMDIFKTLL